MKKLSAFRRIAAVLVAALSLAGCVATRVSTSTSTHENVALERLLIVYRPGSFGGGTGSAGGMAGYLGNRNLGELVPHLYARLPLAFEAQGVQARMASEADLRTVHAQPGERILTVQAQSAFYSSRAGQNLTMVAELTDPATHATLWHGSISMSTLGFGKFDDSVADSIGSQLVKQMLAAHVIVTPGPAVAAAAPAASSASAPAAAGVSAPQAVPTAIARGFASVEDVDAIPYLGDSGRAGYRDWLRKPTPRAFAISDDGHWRSSWGLHPSDLSLPSDPSQRALLLCERAAHKPCRLYAVNGAVVWTKQP